MPNEPQAFPAAWGNHEQGGDYIEGMSLRDWFAGQALSGIAALGGDGFSLSPSDSASWAYQCADAMISERNKKDDR